MAVKTQADPRWDDVRVFLAAYRDGTLGAAAARVGLDISTMSRRLAAFEAALDLRLFDRSRQGLTPTAAAERMLPAAEAMEAALARLTREVSARETTVEGVVRLSVAPGMADAFVAPALPDLRARHPGLRIELDASVRPLDLTRHEAELALRSVRPAGAGLVITRLLTAPWVAMTGRPLARALGRLTAWEDAPWIAWDRDLASLAAHEDVVADGRQVAGGELRAPDLARLVPGHLVDELIGLRALRRAQLPGEMRRQVLHRRRAGRVDRWHDGVHAPAPFGVRQTDDDRVGDLRVPHEGSLDLGGIDVDPTGDDEIGPSVGDVEVAPVVEPPQVADGGEAVVGGGQRSAAEVPVRGTTRISRTQVDRPDVTGR